LPDKPIYVYDVIQQLAVVDEDVLNALDVDVTELAHDYVNKPEYWKPWLMQDGQTVFIPGFIDLQPDGRVGSLLVNDEGLAIAQQRAGCLYFEQTLFPLMDTLGTDDLNQV
jgi:uroporphyrinogen decarboxylase